MQRNKSGGRRVETRWLKLGCAAFGVTVMAWGPASRAQKAPEETLRALKTAPGLETTLFASEPMFANPCDMDIDAQGRVWVTEGWNYRASKLRPDGDRILIMQDTDGDGKADKAITFYQGNEVNSALGICVLGNKAIVSCSPNVYLFTDTDGDSKADKKELLFTGISGVQHDHGVHAFSFGPDGKLYFNMGNEGHQIKDKNGKPIIDLAGNEINNTGKPYRQGMVFRMDPDGSNVETLAWNFRNNYEVAVDSFGTLWQSDNDDDGNRGVCINYVMEYGNFGFTDELTGANWGEAWRKAQMRGVSETEKVQSEWHQYDPGVVPNLLNTGSGSPTGICVYEGKLLPKQFQNQVIHADAGPNVVRAYPLQDDGAGYKADIVNILEGGNDRWFRPSDVGVAPDGSLMVADWYDPGVGGHQTGDKNIKTIRGRVYRVAPEGSKYVIPKLDLSTAEGACAALANPNNATRYLAWTTLHDMQQAAEPALQKLWQNTAEPRLRARALHLLARISGSEAKYLNEAMGDKDADIRITALRIGREVKGVDLLSMVKKLAHDPSAQVRRECAIALHVIKADLAAPVWAELAAQHTAGDRWELEALGIGARDKDDACFDAWMQKINNNWNTPAGREIVWRLRTAKTAPLLTQIILDKSTPPEQLWSYFRALDFIPDAAARQKALLTALDASHGNKTMVVESLSRLKNLSPEESAKVKSMVSTMLDSAKGTPEFVQLVEQFDIKDRGADLLAFAVDHPTDVAAGTAIKLVARNNAKLIESALTGKESAKVAAALGASTDRNIVKLLADIVADARRDLPVRQAAVTALTHSKQGSSLLIGMARGKRLPADVTPLAASLLHNASQRDIRDEAAQVFPAPVGKGSEKLPSLRKLVSMKGNAAHGKEVFVSATCVTCHLVNGQGTSYGPELSEIGAKLPKETIYTSILYPSAGISMGFEGWIISTKDGDDLDGMIASETADEIVLRRAGGINTAIKKSEIKEKRAMKISIMPENLQQQMTPQDLVDLVEYLSGLKKATATK